MRLSLVLFAAAFLAGCHWLGETQPLPTTTPSQIPAKTETAESPYADPGETGGLCGGIAGFQCKSETDYCRLYPGDCTKIADSSGICTPKPAMCTMQYDPVCGCDGKTYGNACTAATQGASVSRQGRCR